VITGTQELRENPQLILFPNPVAGVLTLNLSNDEATSAASVEIMASNGLPVWHGGVNYQNPFVDVSQLSPGLYYLVVRGDSRVIVEKFIVQ